MSACDEEPCKSALGAYNMLLLDGTGVEMNIRNNCAKRRDLALILRLLFLIWTSIAGLAALCLILHFGPPPFCDALFVMALAVMMLMILVYLAVVALTMQLWRLRPQCDAVNRRLREAHAVVQRDCPRECWPAELSQFKCNCD